MQKIELNNYEKITNMFLLFGNITLWSKMNKLNRKIIKNKYGVKARYMLAFER